MSESFTTQYELLTPENWEHSYLQFQDRQAGVSLVYSAEEDCYYYNAYCLEMKILKDLLSVEFDFLSDALSFINNEFHTWTLKEHGESGCSSCAAK